MPANVARQIVQSDLVGRIVREPLYDTETMVNATYNELTFFSRPQGQNNNSAAVKTIRDTNLTQANQLGVPNAHLLMGFQVNIIDAVVTATDADLDPEAYISYQRDLRSWGVFEFGLSGKTIFEIPLSEIPQGLGPLGFTTQAVASLADVHTVAYGEQRSNSYYTAKVPTRALGLFGASSPEMAGYLMIGSSTPITCKIRFNPGLVVAATDTLTLQVRLIGVRQKAIG